MESPAHAIGRDGLVAFSLFIFTPRGTSPFVVQTEANVRFASALCLAVAPPVASEGADRKEGSRPWIATAEIPEGDRGTAKYFIPAPAIREFLPAETGP
jgi:hypothetical protein